MTILTLGPVIFQDFEIPERINSGGSQMLAVHKLPGGQRVIDAMGPDDADIRWSGRFRGFDAEIRALTLDQMRKDGQVLLLTYSLHRYQVVIAGFEASFERAYEIPYSITCTVLADEAAPIVAGTPGIDEILGADLNAALTLEAVLNLATVANALSALDAAMSAVQSIQSASPAQVTGISAQIASAEIAATAAFSAAESVAAAAAPVVGGGSPAAMAAALTTQAEAFGEIDQLFQLQNTLGRMSINVSNART